MKKFTLIALLFLIAGALNLVSAFLQPDTPKLLFGLSAALFFMAAIIFFIKGQRSE